MAMTGIEAAGRVSPLTVLLRGLVERWLSAPVLQQLDERSSGRSYERKITQEALLAIMLDAVMGMQPSVHAAARARRDEWQGSLQALYTKVRRIDPLFCSALVRHTAQEGAALIRGIRSADDWGGRVKILDGTFPDASEHRLGVLRSVNAAALAGHFLIVYDRATKVCEQVVAREDAYESEKAMAQECLANARPGEIYVADRGFSTSKIIAQLMDQQACFVIRENRQSLVYLSEEPQLACGTTDSGKLTEGNVCLHDRFSERSWKLRRIVLTLKKPTEDGDRELRLITNLPRTKTARKIAELYRDRWTIERHFHFIKNELQGQMPSLGEPRAAIFTMCVALAAGNALMVLKAFYDALNPGAAKAKRSLSGYYLTIEISRSYAAIEALTSERDWNEVVALNLTQLRKWCASLAQQINWERFLTTPRGPKHPPPPRGRREFRRHHSTHRLIQSQNTPDAC